ncbi:hypothetical protein MMC21_005362 [Puttea exsequens]|nr:hypothetical protein [Puttea exsequens]
MAVAINDTKAQLLQIIKERDDLRVMCSYLKDELAHAKIAIVELDNQSIELERLLKIAHSQLFANDSSRYSISMSEAQWIGTWKRSPSFMYPALAVVEDIWYVGSAQQALNQMPALLDRSDFGHRHRINARLLYSAIIQSTGGNLHAALAFAEEALRMASEPRLHELAGKAQFQRGMCYYYMGEYARAKWAFVLASKLEGYAHILKDVRQRVDKYLEEFPDGDQRRSISSDFKIFCHSENDKFIFDEATEPGRLMYA